MGTLGGAVQIPVLVPLQRMDYLVTVEVTALHQEMASALVKSTGEVMEVVQTVISLTMATVARRNVLGRRKLVQLCHPAVDTVPASAVNLAMEPVSVMTTTAVLTAVTIAHRTVVDMESVTQGPSILVPARVMPTGLLLVVQHVTPT